MNLNEQNLREELAGLDEKCIAKSPSINPSSPTCTDIFGEPTFTPRLGDDYQVEIPSMLAESEHLPTFELASKTELNIPIMWVHTEDMKRVEIKNYIKGTVATCCTSDGFICNHSLTSKDETVGSSLNHRKAYVSSTYQITECRGCSPLPESRVSIWSDDEIQSFLLGLYIFGKNMAQVRKFIECKDMKDVLSFYYGKFYHSDAYHRWADCRKTRSRKCIQGQRIFTGWRQQELLSRLLTGMPEEVQESLLEATKIFNEGKSLLEELVFTLKAAAGIGALIKAVGIGKGKQDLTGFILESNRNNRAVPSSTEIPAGKACSAISATDIIKFLTGNFRLSKARSNDLFWEAVWPRLLARGWHSERPRNICSKKALVFLIPGIRKFSRRKLVKGDHYFDSVTDVLNKVASDPRLLDLQIEGAKENKNLSTSFSDRQLHPSYLRPPFSNSNSEHIKFTVVDTSLVDGAAGSLKLREMRSIPFDVITNNNIEGTDSDSSMDPLPVTSSNGNDSLEEACMQTCLQTNQPENIQLDKRIQQEQSASLAPLVKRQRLSACKQAMRNGCHKLLFMDKADCGLKPMEALERASSLGSMSEDGFYDEKSRHALIDLNQPQFTLDIDAKSLYQTAKQHNTDGSPVTENQTSSADEEPCSNGRRHGTRNRPPSAKALEALANGFSNIGRTGKGFKNTRLHGMQSMPRFSRRTAEAQLSSSTVFTETVPFGFIDPNFIIPEKLR